MRVHQLPPTSRVYTSNVFLVLGDYSRLDDVNTLVDAGADPAVLDFLAASPTGVGKRAADQVVLTHCHGDHSLMVPAIVERYGARLLGWEAGGDPSVTHVADGQTLKFGDRTFEVLHTPGHSSDSICLYCEEERVLFSGDTPLVINTCDGSYELQFADALERLCARRIETIYFGHGPALTTGCEARLALTLEYVRDSRRRDHSDLPPASFTTPPSTRTGTVTP